MTTTPPFLFAGQFRGVPGDEGPQGDPGDQGPPGPGTGAGAWVATTAYTANQVVQAPDGSMIYRLSSGTSRASFDATEKALWGTVATKAGTMESTGLATSYGASAFDTWALAARPNRFDPVTGAYNYKPSNTRRIRAGLGRAMTGGISRHLAIGDSHTAACIQGLVVPYVFDKPGSWPYQMGAELARHGVPVGGTGWVRCTDDAIATDARWSFSGPSHTGAGHWAAAKTHMFTTTAFEEARFAPGINATALSIWWYDPGIAGYTWGVAIDGATTGQGGNRQFLPTIGAAQWRCATLIPDTPMTPSSEVVIYASPNGVYIAAANAWNPAAGGLLVSNIAQSGSKASGTGVDSWAGTATGGGVAAPGGVYAGISGASRVVTDAVVTSGSATLTSATAAFNEARDLGQPILIAPGASGYTLPANAYIIAVNSATSVTLSVNALRSATGLTATIGQNPDCVHIALMANDAVAGVSAATITAALTTIRNKFPNSDVILYVYGQPATALVAAATWDADVAAVYDLADTLDVPLIDLRGRFGTDAQQLAQGLRGDSSVHMSSAAFAEWGRAVGKLLAS